MAAAGATKGNAADDFLAKVHDSDLVKTTGFVNGQWVAAEDGSTIEVNNPATDEVIANVACMKAADTKSAIAAAAAAFPSWRSKTAKERGAVLRRWYDLVVAAEDDICTIMTVESGKPFKESKAEFAGGASSIEWFAEEGRRVTGDIFATVQNERRMLAIKQPVGVVAAITPWNFPMSMITRKVAPALAAGCTVILKPAEATPLTALALAELAHRAGMPEGVLNIVVGDAKAIGDTLMESDTVRKIGFTGSTRVGKLLFAAAAETVKKVSLELGGNAPFIIFDDADVDMAAAGVVASAFRNAGQTCICANRIFVQEGIYDAFEKAVTKKVGEFKQGGGLDPSTTLGPLIGHSAVDRVAAHVEDAISKGAKVTIGGKKPDLPEPYNKGSFYEPTVISGATTDMKIFREETFGPAIPLFKFGKDEEAVQLANNTEYGLAAYFWTKDLKRSWKVAEELEYGMIGVNEVGITSEVAPFGGIKHSGIGREHSKYGMDEFLYIKYIQMGLGY
ncbi:g5844 [Coccomyxa viridis]|uniref:Succinate-semialdehyde dehydrogenase, mitochondrial n=1 Tax=Coccomyxa viridis TaxID=1274662 RepID=A0ABP1FYZ3_9CHLO